MTKLVVYFDGRPLRDLPRLAWEKVRQQTLRPSDVTRSIPGAWRAVAAGGGGEGEHLPRAALCRGRHLEWQKYGILKFGRFLRIGVCIFWQLQLINLSSIALRNYTPNLA